MTSTKNDQFKIVLLGRNTLTLNDRMLLIQDAKNGMRVNELREKYKVTKSTVYRIIKDENKLRNLAKSANLNRKRKRKSIHVQIEDALNDWAIKNTDQNVKITREMAARKAQQIAQELNMGFDPCKSWIWRWFKRVNFTQPNGKPTIFETLTEEVESDFYTNDKKPSFIDDEVKEDIHSKDFQQINCSTKLEPLDAPIQIENMESLAYNSEQQTDESANISQNSSNAERNSNGCLKYSWLGDLVVSQMEEIHPGDRADFAWEVHKLIRKFQMKRKAHKDNDYLQYLNKE